MKKSFFIYFIIAILCVSLFIVYSAHMNSEKEIDHRYSMLAKEFHLKTKTLIDQKKEATLLLALSLSKDSNVKNALKTNDHSILSLKEITDTYTNHTTFKNVWIHLVNSKGISFLKSWTNRKGESILDIRKDIVSFLKEPQVTSVISVGKYDMTIKAMVPIYNEGKLLGLFEVITKVNSIVKELEKEKTSSMVLVDKKYKKQLRHAYTQTFIGDYYVANLEIDPALLEFMRNIDIQRLLTSKSQYQIIENKFLTLYHLKDVHNEEMGYFFIFKDLNDINVSDIRSKHIIFVLVWIIVMTILLFLFFYFLNKKYTSNLENEIDLKTKELKNINENLQRIIEDEVEKNRQNEIKIIQHEKLLHIATMFRNIAHHWRQPLSIITTSISGLVLRLEYDDLSKDEIKTTIDETLEKAEELSLNIEFFASSYSLENQEEQIDLKELIESAVKVLEPLLDKDFIKVVKKYDNREFNLFYNKSKFLNMIVTLLQNSYEALIPIESQEKIITILLQDQKKYMEIVIKDNGIGINKEIFSKIFEPYTTTKHQSSGVGLSLYFAHNIIVNDLKGSISVENMYPGTRFIIKIPYLNI